MMGALYSSISGLKSNTSWMNVVGNNIANVSTTGFKEGRITFRDAISQSLGAASGANDQNGLGGIDPMQQGLGVSVGSIDTIMTQGAIQTTGNPTDVAIQGTGFFVAKAGDQTMYTRAGNFYFDNEGNLVSSSGALVQGWQRHFPSVPAAGPGLPMVTTADILDTNTPYNNIKIPQNLVLGPQATGDRNVNALVTQTGIFLSGNLDSNTPINGGLPGPANPPLNGYPAVGYVPDAVTTATVYDSLGNTHVIKFLWTQIAATPANPPSWDWTAYDTGSNGQLQIPNAPGPGVPGVTAVEVGNNATAITFNSDGSLANGGEAAGLAYAEITLLNTNGAFQPAAPGQTISVFIGTDNANSPTGVGERDGITGDFGNGTIDPTTNAYIPKQTVYTSFVDGYGEGTLTGVSVDQTGGIDCSFSNNQNIVMAKLAMAEFSNPAGLNRVGSTMFEQSANSGLPEVSTAGNAGLGTTVGGSLEASNVDLSVELTNMIIAQRGFESNARIITTASQMLETLTQLGR